MAGVRALRCSRGCAGGCECGDKGKGSDSSLLGKRLSEDSSRHQLLQKWASMWSSMSEEASVADTEKARLEEAGAAEERPLVFLCCGCRRPLGDSLSWVASQEDTNCILLRCVSCNVSVDKEQKLSKREKENGCILETLYCAGCSLNLGYVYRCTPKNLDYKRDLFCLSVEAIERLECNAVVIAFCVLELLGSSNPPASASQAAKTTGVLPGVLCCPAGFKLLASDDPSVSAS
ncbi:protein Mis18-alpha isoform X2 [Papio anubis]|uniref:Protein Mis18-alpha n=1 Tax=Papio anubis TaxID=9555 RepID=A0A8I5R2B5_PAPAN|nr:protein Mis18-alpha isoform X2 [Papio anubis]